MSPVISDSQEVITTCEELAYCNTLVLEAIVQLLSEKGLLGWQEVNERVQQLKREPSRGRCAFAKPRRPGAGNRS